MKQSKHGSKGQRERDYYSKVIKKTDYEPTVDESLKFPSSDSKEEDYSVSKAKNSRPPKTTDRIASHFKEYWIGWVVSLTAFFLILFAVDFNRDMGKVEGKIENIDNSISNIDKTYSQLNDKVHEQDLKIRENQVHIKYLRQDKKESSKE